MDVFKKNHFKARLSASWSPHDKSVCAFSRENYFRRVCVLVSFQKYSNHKAEVFN